MTKKYKSEFVFSLTKPIMIQDGGQANVAVKEIILKAPSNRQRREVAKLKQGFFRALTDLKTDGSTSSNNEETKKEISGSEVIAVIMMSSKVDFCEYQEIFRELILNDIAIINERQKLTSHMYDDISSIDSESLMGEYFSNFLLSSWMTSLNPE